MSKIYYVDEDRRKDFGNCGRVEYEGKHYRLLDQAEYTNRYFGDSDLFEMSAPAVLLDENGNDTDTDATVFWVFAKQYNDNGEPIDLEFYDYNDIARIIED